MQIALCIEWKVFKDIPFMPKLSGSLNIWMHYCMQRVLCAIFNYMSMLWKGCCMDANHEILDALEAVLMQYISNIHMNNTQMPINYFEMLNSTS